ncbi:MAG: AAA family ATPase [Oscillospiraceae bacterium]|nr:AAA family ATPase [Oscillospiraceae bacterium]
MAWRAHKITDTTNTPQGIIIFGANGSGKTTLGRELARILGFWRMDHEDYCFEKSDIPYTVTRPRERYEALMLADIEKHGSFVLSACTGDFGDKIESLYKLAVYIEAPLELRIERVKQRNLERFGERVLEGGDIHKQQLDFVDFVAKRPLTKIKQWAKTLACPMICIDGTEDWRKSAETIAEKWSSAIFEQA